MAADPADELYESIRRDEVDVAVIAERTGWKASNIAKAKNHLFIEEHYLDSYECLGVPATTARFDSDRVSAATDTGEKYLC